MQEDAPETVFSSKHDLSSGGRPVAFVALDQPVKLPERRKTGLAEFDRALGGGLVPGSAILMGGDPGIGKSTLLLQAAARVASAGGDAVYISGEEAADQVRLRADRLGLGGAPIRLAAATSVRDILTTLNTMEPPALVVIDSIQTMYSDQIEGAPGTVSQVRGCAFELIRYAKASGAALVLVGIEALSVAFIGPYWVHGTFQALVASMLFLFAYDPLRTQLERWMGNVFNRRAQRLHPATARAA
jgi:DNA repair protein RadA/Sms